MKLLVIEDEIRLADILSDWFQKKGFEVTVCHDGLSGYEKAQNENTEIQLENIRLDRLTKEYLTEIKKSDEIHHIRLDGRYLFPSYEADGGKALYCFSV